jgi:D-Tyr-tRNAtyr deacylase
VGVAAGCSALNRVLHIADDTAKDAEALAKKILTLRLFNDESGKQMWKRSVKDIDGEILCGAHFTLQLQLTYPPSLAVYSSCRDSKRSQAGLS